MVNQRQINVHSVKEMRSFKTAKRFQRAKTTRTKHWIIPSVCVVHGWICERESMAFSSHALTVVH
mgnify:CR=1 FL=1